ncbi:nitrous oxide reductase family maturation protein NosD [Oryzobacter terrae]|uniref:right-handed parallel beta-helix repeat-containing protein n=1 Tax=Oryzobacter terrae TaxID=1620385 RepID=UPI003672327C
MTTRRLLSFVLAGTAVVSLLATAPTASSAATDTVVVTSTIQAAVDAASPGDTVVVPAGTYRETVAVTTPGLTIRGPVGAVLDGTGSGLPFGIRVRSLDGSRIDGFTLSGLTVRGFERSGVQLSGVDHFRLTGTRYVDNPLYGLFPVRCSHGRVDHNSVSGSYDSGVYVGQCSDVLVDHNVAHDNTIGLEVELSTRVVVEDNVATDNAIGAMVQISPGRPVKVTEDVVVRRNTLSGNNRPNTVAPEDGLLGQLPGGVGVVNVAGDRVDIVDNVVSGNRSAGIGVVGLPPAIVALDGLLDPTPDGGRVTGNVARGNGFDPDPRLLLPSGDVLWDLTGSPCFSVLRNSRTFPAPLPPCG